MKPVKERGLICRGPEARPKKPVLLAALRALKVKETPPYALYQIMFPQGRFNIDRDCGSAGGGPSRAECAVNWYLGKHAKGMVCRKVICDESGRSVAQGDYFITSLGRQTLAKTEAE